MIEYKPTEYVVDFGDYRSNQFVRLNMAMVEDKGAKLGERIVRCRDCAKWSYFDDEDGLRYGECSEFTAKVDAGCGHATRESGFCAWAEKKVDA